MPDLRTATKRLLYRGQLLPLYHRLRNRHTLTVAMFHEVLGTEDPRWASAAGEWTVSDRALEQCLRFFKRHYHPVSLDDVVAAYRGERPLPSRSLLVTFDDGYAGVEEYALPLLRKYGIPAVTFVYSDAVGQKARPWQEEFASAWERGHVDDKEVADVYWALHPDAPADRLPPIAEMVRDIIRRGAELGESEGRVQLARLREPPSPEDGPAKMLTADQLRRLVENGVAIGAHGKTHTAMSLASDVTRELRAPREVLARALGAEPDRAIRTLSFPHGDFTPEIVEQAKEEGYTLVFTSEEHLTPLPDGRVSAPRIGRVNISGVYLAPPEGVRDEVLALRLFRAPHAASAHR